MRSFKTYKNIIHYPNFQFFMSGSSDIIRPFFIGLYKALHDDQKLFVINHVAGVIYHFLLYDSEYTLRFIIQFNVLFSLICYMEQPFVQRIFSLLFNTDRQTLHPSLQEQLSSKFYTYAGTYGLLQDLAELMLYGSTEKVNQKKNTYEQTSSDIIHLIQSMQQAKSISYPDTIPGIVPPHPATSHQSPNKGTQPAEQMCDIDLISSLVSKLPANANSARKSKPRVFKIKRL